MAVRGETVGVWNGARLEMEESGWHLARSLASTRAMREARAIYTPMTETERRRPERYKTRLARSVLYPAYRDRVQSLASLPFQREPTIEGTLPAPLDRILADADRLGTSLASFAQGIYTDAIDRGLGMFLVDNVPTTQGMSLVDADAIDARPYFARVAPDNLVGFTTGVENGREIVTELRYREWFWRPSASGFDELVDRVRVWDRTSVQVWEGSSGLSSADRFRDAGRGGQRTYVLVSEVQHGYPEGIPLVVVYTKKVATMQGSPALEDLAWLNVAHWQSTSMQGEALTFCRSPILRISGASHEVAEQRPNVGPGATITDTSPDLEVGFVEIAGTSLQAGDREIEMLRLQMEALGMRPMVSAVGGPQTATGEVRADISEKSQAQAWVEALEWGIYQGFEHAAKWLGQTLHEDFDLTLFKDSSVIAGKATDLPILQGMATSRQISHRTYLAEVKARGVLVTVDDIDEEVAAVEDEVERSTQRQMDLMASKMIGEREPDEEASEEGEMMRETEDDEAAA